MDGQGREGPVWCTLISPPDSYACKHACGREDIKKCDHMKILSQLRYIHHHWKQLVWYGTSQDYRTDYTLQLHTTWHLFCIGQVTQQGTGNSKFNYQIVANFEDQVLVDAGVCIFSVYLVTRIRVLQRCVVWTQLFNIVDNCSTVQQCLSSWYHCFCETQWFLTRRTICRSLNPMRRKRWVSRNYNQVPTFDAFWR